MESSLRVPEPVIVTDLFAAERAELLTLLADLTAEEWTRPTICAGWTVHDVAVHLLGGYAGNLARRRDRFANAELPPGDDLVERLNDFNAIWVNAARRLSPPIVIEMLALIGPQLDAHFASIDPLRTGAGVSWAGEGPAPIWLDLAREYTEHWHHQQHIRDAVGRPLLDQPKFLRPVLATFVFALPRTYADVTAHLGTSLSLIIAGPAGGIWTLLFDGVWRIYEGLSPHPSAIVTLPQDSAWRMFTKGISPDEAHVAARIEGDPSLADHLFNAVAIMA